MLDDAHAAGWRALSAARDHLGWTVHRLWIGYFEVGGNSTSDDIRAWLAGTAELPDADHDYLAQALNDGFTALGDPERVLYRSLF